MALPAQVEQTLIPSWFRFHLTLVTLLAGMAVLLAAAAAMMRRGWAVAVAVLIVAEAAVLGDNALAARAGILPGILREVGVRP
jgi:hypothetical protein